MVYYVLMDLEMFLIQLSDDLSITNKTIKNQIIRLMIVLFLSISLHTLLNESFKKAFRKKNIMHKMHHYISMMYYILTV